MANSKNNNSIIHYLPIYGCFSTAIIYISVGVIAILSYFKVKDGGADESSFVAYLDKYFIGKIVIWIILLGTVSYIIWRLYESIKDPYGYGNQLKGIITRWGIAFSTIADALIVFSTIQILLGAGNIQQNGDPIEQRKIVHNMLETIYGQPLLIAIGSIIVITSLVQLFYGVTNGYKERMDTENFSKALRKCIPPLAWLGFISRGIIIGIIGIFFIKAAILHDSNFIVNTDKAFNYIGEHIGHFYFILVALGTICYGVFTITLGIAYDCDKD